MKLFSINRNQITVLTTLVVVVSLVAVYIFFYLPSNEKIIQERRFRALQNIDRNIRAKIENSVALLNNLLDSSIYPAESKRRKDYIAHATQNFTLTVDSIPHAAWRLVDSLKDLYNIEVNRKAGQIRLLLYKEYVSGKDTFGRRGGMQFSFEQFISFLLQKEAFDQYVIFSGNKPVYETFPAGIEEINRDTLFGFHKGLFASGMREFNISGKDYKVFLQPVHISSNESWTIGGLLSNKRYQQERNKLPSGLSVLLLIIAFGAILLFPWIRLFNIGNKDRLTIMDGILSFVIAMLSMSLIFLAFFTYNVNFRLNNHTDSKKVLANNIAAAFTKEIDTIYHKLCSLDTLFNKSKTSLGRDIVFLKRSPRYYDSTGKMDSLPVSLADSLKSIAENVSIKQLFWLDKNGDEKRNWNVDSFTAPHGNFNKRDYFKRIIENNTYFLTGYPPVFDTSHKFYLDQVMSWTSGSFTTVLSVRSLDTNEVAAISVKMNSLENVILPTGYMFAVIDNNGRTLYHSDSSRNLNENLKDEFSGDGKRMLIGSLHSHTESVFAVDYFGREYNVQITPIPYLPYYIVVLADTSFKETRDMEIFSFSFIMLLLLFLLLAMELFTIFFVSAKRSFFKRQFFNTGWVGPRQSCKKEYLLSTFMNCIVIIFLILIFKISGFLLYLFILLFSATITSFFLIGLFARRYKKEKISAYKHKIDAIRSLSIIIGIIDLAAGLLLKPDQFFWLLAYESVITSIGLIIYVNSEAILDESRKFKNSKFAKNWKKILFPVFWKWDHINSFSLAALSRVIITSGIPVVFFYVASYNYEQNIGIRYRQTEFANKLLEKFNGNYDTSHYLTGRNGVYADSSWIYSINLVNKKDMPDVNYTQQEKRTLELLGNFRVYVTNEATAGKDFYKKASDDSLFRYNHLLQDACQNGKGSVTYMQTKVPGTYLKISSDNLNYNFPPLFKHILFWLAFGLFLMLFYFIIYYAIRKLFALKIPDLSIWKDLDEKLLDNNKLNDLVFVIGLPGAEKKTKILQKIKEKKIKSKYTNEDLSYDKKAEWQENDVVIVDLITTPETGNEDDEKKWKEYSNKVLESNKCKLVIVNHFEYNIQDVNTNQHKLNFLEGLMQKDNCKIIILSTIHPVAFLDSMFSQPLKEKAKSATAQDKSVPGQDLERWHVLLGHYRIVLLPLEPITYKSRTITLPQDKVTLRMNRSEDNTIASYKWSKVFSTDDESPIKIVHPDRLETEVIDLSEGEYEFELVITYKDATTSKESIVIEVNPSTTDYALPFVRSIRNETIQTHFLNKMRYITEQTGYEVMTKLKDLNQEVDADEMVFKLQVTAHYFYMYIWQSLTREEKFLLYDLAEDDLVNSFDDYNLSMLVAKGVVIRHDGTLRIFNKGFRNFILTAIGNTEVMKIKDQISDKGSWGKLKAPLMIVVIAILAFLMASQEQTYSRLFTYIGALGTALLTITNLLSKIKGSSNSGG